MLITDTISEQDFLTFERNSEIKHELIFNEPIEISGASFIHNIIAKNIILFYLIIYSRKRGN